METTIVGFIGIIGGDSGIAFRLFQKLGVSSKREYKALCAGKAYGAWI